MTLRDNEKYPNPTPKYLKDGKTGYVYIYSDALFDKGGFHPCNEIPNAQRRPEERTEKRESSGPDRPENMETDDAPEKSLIGKGLDAIKGLTSNAEKTIAQMDINELLVYAKKNFGADIDPVAGEDYVRNEVITLQTASQEGAETE